MPPDAASGDVVSSIHHGEGCHHGAHAKAPLLPGCAVAICTYKRARSLKRFLESLAKQERRPDQLIIVDASPDTETEEMVASESWVGGLAPCFQYFRVAEPLRGLTRQRNFALRQVSADLLAFFDDDLVLEPRCLEALERAHRSSTEPIAGVGALENVDLVANIRLWRLRRLLRMVPSLEPGRYYRSGITTPWAFLQSRQGLFEGEWLPGGATMWRTSVVRELKFKEEFRGYAQSEDVEFSLRAARFGKLLLAAHAQYRDDHAPAGRPDAYQLGYMAIRNRYLIHRDAFPHRDFRDVLWFVYAWTLDTLLFARFLRSPRQWVPAAREVAGRLRATYDILVGR
jgi:GT2 family glycosyltransferase